MKLILIVFFLCGVMIMLLGMASAQNRSGEGITSDQNWRNYTNEVGKILRRHRKIDPKHNPADRPLKDPLDHWGY